jgi:hypothetical protein
VKGDRLATGWADDPPTADATTTRAARSQTLVRIRSMTSAASSAASIASSSVE